MKRQSRDQGYDQTPEDLATYLYQNNYCPRDIDLGLSPTCIPCLTQWLFGHGAAFKPMCENGKAQEEKNV